MTGESFHGVLFTTVEGPGAWLFVEVPAEHAPEVSGAWGRSPVAATVDGRSWDTSVWRERGGRVLLPVPKRMRAGKDVGAEVVVSLLPR
ncbi:MAG: DUF1905 domain-containing protein [Myxococcales bacterium]|nr:DUF1905 domain-containing protein [Myxococcales bacterium]